MLLPVSAVQCTVQHFGYTGGWISRLDGLFPPKHAQDGHLSSHIISGNKREWDKMVACSMAAEVWRWHPWLCTVQLLFECHTRSAFGPSFHHIGVMKQRHNPFLPTTPYEPNAELRPQKLNYIPQLRHRTYSACITSCNCTTGIPVLSISWVEIRALWGAQLQATCKILQEWAETNKESGSTGLYCRK